MLRAAQFSLLLTTGLAACVQADRVDDPSPQGTLSQNLNEPTDGFANEIGTD